MAKTYKMVMDFKKKYPMGLTFRIKQHCAIIDKHLNPGEEVIYAFPAQKNNNFWDILNTNIVALTNKRIMIGTKRLLWGYFFTSITPDMFNDLTVSDGLIWGSIIIDTIKEEVTLSNIPSKALPEIETQITDYMMEAKKLYKEREEKQ
jgi:hypothetical protein